MQNFIILSGCSGGGKSTLLKALGKQGHATVEEAGRRIVEESLAGDERFLPWIDLAAFARKALEVGLQDRKRAAGVSGWVFFDRSLIDAASALEEATRESTWLDTLTTRHRYNPSVFLTPPWPEIYETDRERKHDLEEAVSEYRRLVDVYPRLGYETIVLPKAPIEERVAFVLKHLEG